MDYLDFYMECEAQIPSIQAEIKKSPASAGENLIKLSSLPKLFPQRFCMIRNIGSSARDKLRPKRSSIAEDRTEEGIAHMYGNFISVFGVIEPLAYFGRPR